MNEAIPTTDRHFVHGRPIYPPFPDNCRRVLFGMGCFWGAEKRFWTLDGVVTTAVGYAGGSQPNPTYRQVCDGNTGHAEVVLVVYDDRIAFGDLLKVFWESHDPTQGMRQGADVGSQYRSAIYVFDDRQRQEAEASRTSFQRSLTETSYGAITTEILSEQTFYYGEDYHQQYLAKNPDGYCGLGGTGVCYDLAGG